MVQFTRLLARNLLHAMGVGVGPSTPLQQYTLAYAIGEVTARNVKTSNRAPVSLLLSLSVNSSLIFFRELSFSKAIKCYGKPDCKLMQLPLNGRLYILQINE